MSCCPPDAEPYLAADHTDKGRIGDADGVAYYQVGISRNGLLLLPDVWGWNGGRIRALADEFAKKGVSVWVPKLLEPFEGGTDGDGLPPVFDIQTRGGEVFPAKVQGEWGPETVMPKVRKVVAEMKRRGLRRYGVIGFCYGAWIGFHLSKEVSRKEMMCGVAPHPSVHLEGLVGGDPNELAKSCQCPWALYPCGDAANGGDGDMYDADGALFKNLKDKFPQSVTKRFGNMRHGFFTRGAIKEGQTNAGEGDEVKAAVQECFNDIVSFLAKMKVARGQQKLPEDLAVGMKLHAKYTDGQFYPAEVLAISTALRRARAPVKVHYVGYEDTDDAWLALADVKSKKLPKLAEPKAKAKQKPRRKPPPIKLTYFDIEGLAEKIRLALTIGGIDFEDERIKFDQWEDMKSMAKYGQLPMMKIGEDEAFAQSGAMLRVAGRMARLYPPAALQKIEEIIGLEEEIGKTLMPSLYMGMRPHLCGYPEDLPQEERTKIQLELRAKLIAEGGDLVRMLGYLEKNLEDGSPYLCGKTVTIADCQVIPRLRHLKKGILDGIPPTIVDGFPKIVEYYDRFHDIPEVKAYYEKLAAK